MTTLKKYSTDRTKKSNKIAALNSQHQQVVKQIISSPNVFKPIGPHSHAVLAGNTFYVSGVLGIDKDWQLVCGGAETEAKQALENLNAILEAGGASLRSVCKITILLVDIDDYEAINQIYTSFFTRDYPARTTYQVVKLPLGASVEIEAIALSGDLVVAEAGPCPCARE